MTVELQDANTSNQLQYCIKFRLGTRFRGCNTVQVSDCHIENLCLQIIINTPHRAICNVLND